MGGVEFAEVVGEVRLRLRVVVQRRKVLQGRCLMMVVRAPQSLPFWRMPWCRDSIWVFTKAYVFDIMLSFEDSRLYPSSFLLKLCYLASAEGKVWRDAPRCQVCP